MAKLGFATIGTSAIADRFLDALAQEKRAFYAAAYSRNAARARNYADKHGAHASYSELEELLCDENVDCVYIASPNALHAKQALLAIAAGKHVLVEKPFASNAAEAARVFEAAHAAGVVAMEAMRNLHGPGFAAIEKALPRIGAPRLASFGFSKVTSRYARLMAGERLNLFDPELSGGALMDIGVYVVEPAVMLFGAPLAVKSASTCIDVPWSKEGDSRRTIDLAGSAILSYPGHTVTLSWGKLSNDLAPSQIQGEAGTILFDECSYPRSASFHAHTDKGMVFSMGEEAGEELAIDAVANDMSYELADFAGAVLGDTDALAIAQRMEGVTLASLAVMDQIRSDAHVVFSADA